MRRTALFLATALLASPLFAQTAPKTYAQQPVTQPQATLIGRSTHWKPGYSGDFDHFGYDAFQPAHRPAAVVRAAPLRSRRCARHVCR